jgi:O-methyltransferase
VGSRQAGPFVLTMERDSKAFDVAVTQLRVMSEHGLSEQAAEAMCALRSNPTVAPVLEDTVSLPFDCVATCELMRVSDALAAIEEMSAGRGSSATAPFDLVFLDADKTRLLDYTEALLSSNLVLKPGGLIVVDNVLWKGLVLEASAGVFSSLEEFADSEEAELRKNRRARKLANKMHRFNSEIVQDNRVEVLVLPMRDGLSVIRKR